MMISKGVENTALHNWQKHMYPTMKSPRMKKTACSRSFRLPSEPHLGGVAAPVKVEVRIGLSW